MIIITSSKHLYMGNKMLQYAIFIAFAEENNVNILNPSFAPYAHHFKTTSTDFFNRYPAKQSLFFSRAKKIRLLHYKFMHHFGRFLAAKNISNKFIRSIDIDWTRVCHINDPEFTGFAKNTKYLFAMGWEFKHKMDMVKHREKIKKYFEPLDVYQKNVKDLMVSARAGTDILVGVHIRQGDYKTFEGGRYFYETVQYVEMMGYASQLFPGKKVRFLVCSNSKQPAELFSGYDFCFGTDHPIEDMYSFAECDYIMGPPSTYTMWSSFYGAKPLYMIHNVNGDFKITDFKIINDLSA